jgi:holliday junction DNA helicase RuvB
VAEDEILKPNTDDPEEKKIEQSIRPKTFADLIGRKKEKDALGILINAAKNRSEALDHILFHGPPGLGKTTFAHVVANEMGSTIRVTSGPALERQGDLAAILTNLNDGDILFIDEIHRLSKTVEEVLYPAMEDYAIDLVLGKGNSAKTMRLDLPKFTLIGATTRIGLLSSPLRDRFGVLQRLDFFSPGEIKEVILRASKILNAQLEESGAAEISKRARGTGRIAIRLLKRVRDFASVNNYSVIDLKAADEALNLLEVDKEGLDEMDRKILEVIVKHFNGGPVGLSSIAAVLSEEIDTIADVYEPFLLQSGFIKRTKRGRIATDKAYKHLGEEDFTGGEQKRLL